MIGRHKHNYLLASADIRCWREEILIRIVHTTWRECECGKKKRKSTKSEIVWDRKDHVAPR